jgi:hypothetical protein
MLRYGIEKDGARHKEFTLRLPTLEDVECAIEDAGDGACTARISRHKWARCLTRLGTIPQKSINADLLAALPAQEYGIFQAAEDELLKKLDSVSADTSKT